MNAPLKYGLLVLPAAVAFLLVYCVYHNHHATSAASSSITSGTSLRPCLSDPKEPLRGEACEEVNALLSDLAKPQWEQTSGTDPWSTKCELGLQPCGAVEANAPCPQTFSSTEPAANSSAVPQSEAHKPDRLLPDQLRAVFSGARPSQLRLLNKDKTEEIPDLASVLFNKKASDFIKPSSPCETSRFLKRVKAGDIPDMPECSIIAKTFWGILKKDEGGHVLNTNLLYGSKTTDELEETTNENTKPVATIPNQITIKPGKLDTSWAPFPFDLSKISFDGDCKSGQFDSKCVHTYTFNALDPANLQAMTQMHTPDTVRGVFQQNCGRNICQVVLLGVHFMIRERAQLPTSTRTGLGAKSHWRFVTLWWNGKDNGLGLSGPWRYYELRATEDWRNDSMPLPTDGRRNVIYNPYLEGLERNGSHSNCITCHQYAAFNKTDPAKSRAGCAVGPSMGLVDIPGAARDAATDKSNQLGQNCPTADEYFKSHTRTDFVWSFANFVIPQPAAQ